MQVILIHPKTNLQKRMRTPQYPAVFIVIKKELVT